jgi:hypothetical protein
MNFFTLENGKSEINKDDKVLFRTATEFSTFITDLAFKNDDTLTNTLLEYCEDRDIDPEDIAKLISRPLKERLAIEMQEAGLMQRDSTASFEDKS